MDLKHANHNARNEEGGTKTPSSTKARTDSNNATTQGNSEDTEKKEKEMPNPTVVAHGVIFNPDATIEGNQEANVLMEGQQVGVDIEIRHERNGEEEKFFGVD